MDPTEFIITILSSGAIAAIITTVLQKNSEKEEVLKFAREKVFPLKDEIENLIREDVGL